MLKKENKNQDTKRRGLTMMDNELILNKLESINETLTNLNVTTLALSKSISHLTAMRALYEIKHKLTKDSYYEALVKFLALEGVHFEDDEYKKITGKDRQKNPDGDSSENKDKDDE